MSNVKRYLWLTGLLEDLGYKYDASFEGNEIAFTDGVRKVFFDEQDFERYRVEGSTTNIVIIKSDGEDAGEQIVPERLQDKTIWDKIDPLDKQHNHEKAYRNNVSTGIRHYSISWNKVNEGYTHQIRFGRENKTYVVLRETLHQSTTSKRFVEEAMRLNKLLNDKGVEYVVKNVGNLFVGYCGCLVKGGRNDAN